MNDDKRKRSKRRGSLFFPLLLIAIGLILLLNSLGVLEGDVLDTILNLWPVLLIVLGVDGIYRREGVVAGTLLTGLGIIFLLANLGLLAVDIWQMVFTLWPLLLIAFGFDILIARRSFWASLVGVLLILAILVGSLWLFNIQESNSQAVVGQEINQPLNGVNQAKISIEPGVGRLFINALSQSNDLIAGSVSTGGSALVEQTYSRDNSTASYSLKSTGSASYIPGLGGQKWTWNLGITPEIPLDLETHLGAGSANLALTSLKISDLHSELGVGYMVVTLPEAGRIEAKVNGAIGRIVVFVPEGMAVRLQGDVAIASIQVPDTYREQGDFYTSPGYENADNRVELLIDMAIGIVSVKEVPVK